MTNKKSTFTGFGAALLALLGTITCCGAPIAAGILATIGIGASQLEVLAGLQPYLIAIAIISLAYAFYKTYFKKASSCCDPNTGSNKKSKVFLWLISLITIVILIFSFKSSSETSCCPTVEVEQTNCCVK